MLSCHFDGESGTLARSVSSLILAATLDLPALPLRLTADCNQQILHSLALEPGDVEALPLARARMRWPEYRRCVQAMSDWMTCIGLGGLIDDADLALMACRGARYHHDANQYGHAAFCNLFLSEDKGLDLHFPLTGQRIALQRGSAVVFDTGQPHAVVERGCSQFAAERFLPGTDCTLLFLSWELPITNSRLAQSLDVRFHNFTAAEATGAVKAEQGEQPRLFLNGKPGHVCPATGRWMNAERVQCD